MTSSLALERLARGDDDGDALGVGGGWRHGGVSWGSGSAGSGTSRGGKLPSPPMWRPRRRGAPPMERCRGVDQGSQSDPGDRRADGAGLLPDGFLFGVATAGFQVEGGFNGPGQPANNWLAWEQVGRVDAVGRRRRLLAAARAGARPGRRPGVRQLPAGRRVGPRGSRTATASTGRRSTGTWPSCEACVERGLTPLVTLHHFTHPAVAGRGPLAPPRRRRPASRRGPGSWCRPWPRPSATG